VALGINPEKTIAWIGDFPLIHFFTTRKFGNVAQKYGTLEAAKLEGEIQKAVGSEVYSRIHLIPYGDKIWFDDIGKSFKYLQRFGQGVILKRSSDFIHVITLYVGDCYPILITDAKYTIMGILHGGYKQLKHRIVKKAIQLIQTKFKIELSSIILGIGPGIKECCYRTKLLRKANLLQMILDQAQESGVKQIFVAGVCTYCTKLEGEEDYLFFSHQRARRQREPEGRFAAVLTSRLIGSG